MIVRNAKELDAVFNIDRQSAEDYHRVWFVDLNAHRFEQVCEGIGYKYIEDGVFGGITCEAQDVVDFANSRDWIPGGLLLIVWSGATRVFSYGTVPHSAVFSSEVCLNA